MKKAIKKKIAISIDAGLLGVIDSKVDDSVIRSRSQAIEFYLKKGLQGQSINTALLLIKGDHQQILLKQVQGKSLIRKQIEFFAKHGITNLYLITQHSRHANELLSEISQAKINVEIIEASEKGSASALLSVKSRILNHFIVMSGDIYNDFDLSKMIKKHTELNNLATMGLMTREETKKYGTAILDGDYIIDFQEKPRQSSTHIVNAGIYVFKPEIFELLENNQNLERDLFPRLARMKQLIGFFTYGEYAHLG